jgi:hypothetical protein
MQTPVINFKRHRFAPQIIAHAVWLYLRFNLSLREVKEMLLERGMCVCYETWKADSRRLSWILDRCYSGVHPENLDEKQQSAHQGDMLKNEMKFLCSSGLGVSPKRMTKWNCEQSEYRKSACTIPPPLIEIRDNQK